MRRGYAIGRMGKRRALTFRWERGSKGKSRPNAGRGSLNVEILMDLLPKGRQKLEFIEPVKKTL